MWGNHCRLLKLQKTRFFVFFLINITKVGSYIHFEKMTHFDQILTQKMTKIYLESTKKSKKILKL